MSNEYELYHHGILGQKWGIRRYQNPDGSLTEEGRQRYRKLTSGEYIMTPSGVYKYRKAANGKYIRTTRAERKAIEDSQSGKRASILKKSIALKNSVENKDSAEKIQKAKENLSNDVDDHTQSKSVNRSPRDKDIKGLTDKQLEKYITRMKLEKDAIDVRNKIRELDPKPVSRGKKFMDTMMDKVVVPTMQEAGKKALEMLINKWKGPDKFAEAKQKADYTNNLKQIENNTADYNKTKAINDEYKKTGDINVYFKNKDNNNNNKKNNKDNTNNSEYMNISKNQKKSINELLSQGKTVMEAANKLGLSEEVVWKYVFGNKVN